MSAEYIATCCASSNVDSLFTLPYIATCCASSIVDSLFTLPYIATCCASSNVDSLFTSPYIATCCASSNVDSLFTLPYYHFDYVSYYLVCWIHFFDANDPVCQFCSWYIDIRLLQGQV